MTKEENDKVIENAIRDGIKDGIRDKLKCQYNNPINDLITAAIKDHVMEFRKMLDEAIGACLNDKVFREEVAVATRHSLAKVLVARFGGELEKQVNLLKSDPTTRARITLAIEEIVKQKVA